MAGTSRWRRRCRRANATCIEDLLGLVRALGAGPVRDVGLLDAACARPRSTVFGQDAYASLEHKAAALLHSSVRNHALVDGNKRLGLAGHRSVPGHQRPPARPDR